MCLGGKPWFSLIVCVLGLGSALVAASLGLAQPASPEPAAPAPSPAPAIEGAPAPMPTAAPTVAQLPSGPPARSTVRLVSAGAEPRAELRYAAAIGTREAVMVTTRSSTDLEMGFGVQVTRLPATRVIVEMGPVGDAGAGRLMVAFHFTALEVVPTEGVSPDVVARLQREFSPIVGLQGYQLIDRQGLGTAVDIVIPPGTPTALAEQIQALRRNLHDLFAPFPAEPVGLGAVWEVRTQVETNHILAEQVTTYTLTARAGEEISLGVTLTQTAPGQDLPAPQPGVRARLDSLQATGTGSMDLKLSHLTPTTHLLTRALVHSTVATGGFAQRVRMGMDLDVSFGLP
ncbi:MAG: hypothetical protein H6726_02820 [Sandaracinaceae bacterium]|nr:hypothetical protein [Sandaracinaceae bacterium]